ncbi:MULTISPECIES: hypothetical protein [Methylomonas]|uniref:Lipopolysaccharide assembly protein A domain-containing protein n=2 Tax=Methylomonas TaxID=416 RepID=A0A126T7V4_9GAMM|nr:MULTISPECIES: hypothetical protein [Methylomonas]AMK78120.1 hypothetical protein JT25_016800 [Methylomonas denitrificans]OAH96482.1 hypothetical protein A1342_03045 [Methylomonas methanica]TCV85656.1 hypothetical protein EDE11_105218 [Methylomonas methanica]
MKSDKFLLAAGALLLAWSMHSEAHDSHEAMMTGGNLLQLTRALLHPILEIPYLPALLIGALILGLVLGPVILHIVRRRIGSIPSQPIIKLKTALAPKANKL